MMNRIILFIVNWLCIFAIAQSSHFVFSQAFWHLAYKWMYHEFGHGMAICMDSLYEREKYSTDFVNFLNLGILHVDIDNR